MIFDLYAFSAVEELEYDFIENPHGAYHYGGVVRFQDLMSCSLIV